MKVYTETIDFKRIKQFLAEGCKVSLLIRHSERPTITPGDTTFGHSLALTPRGEAMAREAGRLLSGPYNVRFLSSPMVRCQMTAACLAEGMGCAGAEVMDEPILGVKNFYYANIDKLPGEMMRCGYIQYMLDYLRTGSALYSHDVAVATPQMVAWLKRMTTQQLNMLVSHDIFVAALLSGIKACTYTAENWVGFLHSAAVISTPECEWFFYPCVPSLDVEDATSFVQ
ncbi:MAG: histidine phosphatase family protein [Terrimicrobiaceae bacterium]